MNTIDIDLIVTRHPALVALLIERGIATADTPVIEHASVSDVKGKHVLGVLPHHLSSQCASITEIPMRLTQDDRVAMQAGDLTLERLREVAGEPVRYVVRREHEVETHKGDLAILETLTRILIPEHAYLRREGGHDSVRYEAIMDTAVRLRDAWEADHPRAKLVRMLIEKLGHMVAAYDPTTGRTHVLYNGLRHWLPTDEQIRRSPDTALYNAVNALGEVPRG